jgi:hypothetical protein
MMSVPSSGSVSVRSGVAGAGVRIRLRRVVSIRIVVDGGWLRTAERQADGKDASMSDRRVRLRVRARELRPGDAIVLPWSGEAGRRIDHVYVVPSEHLDRRLGAAGFPDRERARMHPTTHRMVALYAVDTGQRWCPELLDPSSRLTIDREVPA